MIADRLFTSLDREQLITLSPMLLQTVLDTVPTGIQVLRAIRNEHQAVTDFEYILINEAAKEYTQADKTFLHGNPEKRELFNLLVEGLNNPSDDGPIYSFVSDGVAPWFLIRYAKFGDGILLSVEDITAKKMSVESNQTDQHLMQQIAESSPDIIYILDLSTELIIYTNREIAVDLGYSKQQAAQMKNPLWDILHEEDVAPMKEHLEKAATLPDNAVLEIEHRMKNVDGTLSWYRTRTSVFKRNKTGKAVEKLGISQNITVRKLQEEQNFTTLNILKQAEDISEMGTWVYDVKDDTFTWSEGMYRLFNLPGYSTVSPEIYLDFVPTKERPLTGKIVQKIKTAEPFEEKLHLLIPGQGQKTVRIKAIVIKDNEGMAIKSIGVDRDITMQEKLEEKIDLLNESLSITNRELATANLELQTFSSIAANDFKETLKHLYTNMEFITSVEAQNLSNAGRANIRRAQSAIQKMKLLTEDIILYSDIQNLAGNKTEVVVNEIMASIKAYTLRKMKEEDIQIDCDDLPVLKGYPELLSLLFHHLIDNALKFHQGGGRVIIHIKCNEQEGSSIKNRAAMPGRRYYIISITDNGHGFNPEHAEDIFSMFYRIPGTTNHKGSGMGLAICKKIMDIHGGFILAESIEGNGASFTCYFPKETA